MPSDLPEWLTLAHQLGVHALPAFYLGLALWLLLVSATWWLTRTHWLPHTQRRLSPSASLGLHLALGFAAVLAAAALFAEIAEHLGTATQLGPVGQLDDALSSTLRHTVSRPTLQAFAWVTHFGDTATLTGLCTAVALWLLWRQRRALALGWVLAVAGNSVLNVSLKGIFERVRPLHEHGLAMAQGYSFPSGHSSGSVVAYGMLAYVVLRNLPATAPRWVGLPVLLLAASIAFATGWSRVFLQVHYASDVLAGFASGLAWLVVCISGLETVRYRQRTGLGPE